MSSTAANIPPRVLTGIQKAAIVTIAMGPGESASILKHMPEQDADRLAKAIAQLDRVSPDEVESTLEEFSRYTASDRLCVKGGLEYASKVLIEAYGPTTAQGLIDRLTKSI